MQVIPLNLNYTPILSDSAKEILTTVCDNGELIICPTESSYLIGGNALKSEVCDKIYSLKSREQGKPLPVIVGNLEMASSIACINDWTLRIANSFWPGPVTVIIPAKEHVPECLTAENKTIGLRVSAFPLLQEIFSCIDYPLISTSANISGTQEPYDPELFLDDLIANNNAVSLFLNGGTLPSRKPSTIVDLTGVSPLIRREGAIPSSEILTILNA